MPAPEYYIVSLERTRVIDGCVSLLRPDRLGVTHRVNEAGRYSEAEVNSDLQFYDDGQKHMALLCEAVEEHTEPMVPLIAITSQTLIETDMKMRGMRSE